MTLVNFRLTMALLKYTAELSLVILLLVLLGCQAGAKKSAPEGGDAGPEERNDYGASEVVFEAEHLQVFEVTVAPDDLTWLRENAVAEISVPAQLSVDGEDVGEVGIRYKGAYSLDHCFDDSGAQTCPKVSMKIKFSEYDKEKRWHGLRRLAFDAPFWDTSLLRERLADDMYRELGIVAPRVNHGQLIINGENQGLFALVEQVDGGFTDDRWPGNGDGNLYKEAWPGTDGEGDFAARLKTNEETGTHDTVLRFGDELRAAADEALAEVVSRWMDVDYHLQLLALDEAIRNWDGITTFYGSPPGHNHNYYLYQEEDEDRFWIIAWDLDQTFEVTDRIGDVPRWSDPPGDCGHSYSIHSGQQRATAPNCDPLLRGLAQFDSERYLKKVQAVLDGPFVLDEAYAKLDRWAAQIADAVAADPHGPGTDAWEFGLEDLRRTLALLRERLQNHRDGVESAPFGLVPGMNDFEATDGLGFAAGVFALTNSKSSNRVTLNRDDPLNGGQDMRIQFELRNESDDPMEGGGTWNLIRVAMASEPTDLLDAGIARVRIKARADQSRKMRVDFESGECHRYYEGICFGWEVEVTEEAQSFELVLDEAALPSWAGDDGENLEAALKSAIALVFRPEGVGRDANGLLKAGTSDPGWVQVDDIELFD